MFQTTTEKDRLTTNCFPFDEILSNSIAEPISLKCLHLSAPVKIQVKKEKTHDKNDLYDRNTKEESGCLTPMGVQQFETRMEAIDFTSMVFTQVTK